MNVNKAPTSDTFFPLTPPTKTTERTLTQSITWPSSTFTGTVILGPSSATAGPPKSLSSSTIGAIVGSLLGFLFLLLAFWYCCSRNGNNSFEDHESDYSREVEQVTRGGGGHGNGGRRGIDAGQRRDNDGGGGRGSSRGGAGGRDNGGGRQREIDGGRVAGHGGQRGGIIEDDNDGRGNGGGGVGIQNDEGPDNEGNDVQGDELAGDGGSHEIDEDRQGNDESAERSDERASVRGDDRGPDDPQELDRENNVREELEDERVNEGPIIVEIGPASDDERNDEQTGEESRETEGGSNEESLEDPDWRPESPAGSVIPLEYRRLGPFGDLSRGRQFLLGLVRCDHINLLSGTNTRAADGATQAALTFSSCRQILG